MPFSPILQPRGQAHAFAASLTVLALTCSCGHDSANGVAAGDANDAGDASDANPAQRRGDSGIDATLADAANALDGGPAVDAAPPPCSGPGSSPDGWSTYGHDAQRTSASNGCIHGSLTETWRYGGKVADAGFAPLLRNAIGDTSALYVHVSATAPTVDRVGAADGKQLWRYKGPADYDTGNWLTLGLGYVMANDDGIYLLNTADGGLKSTSGVDWWGQSAADDARFYVVTSTHGDGPGAFVGAWDVTKNLVWKANQQGGCNPPVGDENGALAVHGGVVFFAPRYALGSMSGIADGGTFAVASGVYAFDAALGSPKWSMPTSPQSSISVGDGHVYLIEKGPALVARNETDGTIAWSTPLSASSQTIGSQPPVVALGRVIIGTSTDALAFDAATGKAAWSTPIKRAALHGNDGASINFVSCPSAGEPNASPITTTMAAALASGTLVVAGADALHVLSLATGIEQGAYPLVQATNPIVIGDRVYVMVSTAAAGSQLLALQSH